MTDYDDDRLMSALWEMQSTRSRPVVSIQRRGKMLRRRRRVSVLGVVSVALAASIVPTVRLFDDELLLEPPPATTVRCPSTVAGAHESINEALLRPENRLREPERVPDAIRLLWEAGPGQPAPRRIAAYDYAFAEDRLADLRSSCPVFSSQAVTMTTVRDGRVSSRVTVRHRDLAYEPDQARTARTLESGSTRIAIVRSDRGKDLVSAEWGMTPRRGR